MWGDVWLLPQLSRRMRGYGYEIMGIYRGNGALYVPRVWVSGVICGVKDADTVRMWIEMEMELLIDPRSVLVMVCGYVCTLLQYVGD